MPPWGSASLLWGHVWEGNSGVVFHYTEYADDRCRARGLSARGLSLEGFGARPANSESLMRIFLSSTWQDLQYERQIAYWTARSLGHDVVRMEDYGSRTFESWDKCAEEVAQADLVLLILG